MDTYAAATHSDAFRKKMQEKGLKQEFIEGWVGLYEKFCAGDKGMIAESALEPVTDLPELGQLPEGDASLLGRTVVLKLNGGLGTGMGLDKAKSLLEIKNGDTFLDLIAKQIMQLRKQFPVRFMLMNSFSTEDDTKDFFKKYPEIYNAWDSEVSFLQNMSPKVDADSKMPTAWPDKPSCEWCPPGHGDIYAALVVSGKLDKLIEEGYEYVFVSNSDNLGATLDMRLLGYLASTNAPMLMEVCVRGEDDKKGGHLAIQKATGILTLRESAQCPKEDEKAFQDINKHKFFNTNNLWLNLRLLKNAMAGGVLPLPLIVNEKKVDPASKQNPGHKVYQLETAMGAAISCLPGSQAICVPFERFAPVKTCNQLFGLRSDAYMINHEFKPVLAPGALKPIVDFDDNYKMVPDMEAAVPHGVPSLRKCKKVTVKGKVIFGPDVVIEGEVGIFAGDNKAAPAPVVTGTIRGTADKLRILRDADDGQPHVAGGLGAPFASARGPFVARTLTGQAPPQVRTVRPGVMPLGSTMRGYVQGMPMAATASGASVPMPQVIKTMPAMSTQIASQQVVAHPAPFGAAMSPPTQQGASWVAAPRYVVPQQPGTPVQAGTPVQVVRAAP